MQIECIFEAGDWPDQAETWAGEIAEAVSQRFDLGEFEATVLFTDDDHIRALNAAFRDKDKATDVLSWPSQEFPREVGEVPALPVTSEQPFADALGDIALALETCIKDARDRDFGHHIKHLVLHGFLHLLGYDHVEDEDAVIMEALEVEILEKMHIDNPYEEKQV